MNNQNNSINIGDNNNFSGNTQIGQNIKNKTNTNSEPISVQGVLINQSDTSISSYNWHSKKLIIPISLGGLTLLSGLSNIKIFFSEINVVDLSLNPLNSIFHIFLNNNIIIGSLIITFILLILTIGSYYYQKRNDF